MRLREIETRSQHESLVLCIGTAWASVGNLITAKGCRPRSRTRTLVRSLSCDNATNQELEELAILQVCTGHSSEEA